MSRIRIINIARTVSIMFTPFYWSVFWFIFVFIFVPMSRKPFDTMAAIVGITYIFTILLPTLLIRYYRKYNGWSHFQLGSKERRMIPYIISILSYFTCYYILNFFQIIHMLRVFLIFAILTQIACAIINVWWKISTHTAGLGAMTSATYFYSVYYYHINHLWWICILILISGLVGTSRMILRQHSLAQVIMGYVLGFFITLLVLLYSHFSRII